MERTIIFSTFQEILYHPDLGYYTTYGIEAAPFCSLPDTENRLQIHDISIRRYEVECLVYRMNMGGLSPLHLSDVVEDFLARF